MIYEDSCYIIMKKDLCLWDPYLGKRIDLFSAGSIYEMPHWQAGKIIEMGYASYCITKPKPETISDLMKVIDQLKQLGMTCYIKGKGQGNIKLIAEVNL